MTVFSEQLTCSLCGCVWIGILGSPLRQAAVHATASEWIVPPYHAPGTVVELVKEQLAAAWAAKVRLPVADHDPYNHPRERGKKDSGAVAVAPPPNCAAREGQAREVGPKPDPERSAPSPVTAPRRQVRALCLRNTTRSRRKCRRNPPMSGFCAF
jgi:hypothetical protein